VYQIGAALMLLEEAHAFPSNLAEVLQDRNLRQRLADSMDFANAVSAAMRFMVIWMSADDRLPLSRMNLDDLTLETLVDIIRTREFVSEEGRFQKNSPDARVRHTFCVWCTGFLALASELGAFTEFIIQSEIVDPLFSRLVEMVCLSPVNAAQHSTTSEGSVGFREASSREMGFVIRLIGSIGAYEDVIPVVVNDNWRGVEVVLELLQRSSVKADDALLEDVLRMLCALFAHRSYGTEFVRRKGLRLLLDIPRRNYVCSMLALSVSSLMSVSGVMEEICNASEEDVVALLELILDLTSRPVDSARKNGTLAMGSGVIHPTFLRAFRSSLGMEILLDVIRSALAVHENPEHPVFVGRIHGFASRICALNAAFALRQYFRAELILLSEKLRSGKRKVGHNPFAALNINFQSLLSASQVIRRSMKKVDLRWSPVESLVAKDGHRILADLVSAGSQWDSPEVSANALEVLEIITVLPQYAASARESPTANGSSQGSLAASTLPTTNEVEAASTEPLPPASRGSSMIRSLVLAIGSGVIGDGAVVISALRSVCNLVHPLGWCLPMGSSDVFRGGDDDGLSWARESIRSCQGISPLIWRLHIQTPTSKADKIRHLACRALLGMSRLPAVLQVLTSHQISDELSDLIRRGPALAENRASFDMFREEALELIARTSGRSAASVANETSDPTMLKIARSAVAMSTIVTYPERELLQLIHDHLLSLNLNAAANALIQEASARTDLFPLEAPSPRLGDFPAKMDFSVPRKRIRLRTRRRNSNLDIQKDNPIPLSTSSIPSLKTSQADAQVGGNSQTSQGGPRVTLAGIVKVCLLSQHSSCPMPIAAPPPFSLLQPHRCPHLTRPTEESHCSRIIRQRETGGPFADFSTKRILRKLSFSRFRPVRTLHDPMDESATCASFLGSTTFGGRLLSEAVMVGSLSGTVSVIGGRMPAGMVGRWTLSLSRITSLEVASENGLLLSCCAPFELNPESNGGLALWNLSQLPDPFLDTDFLEDRAPLPPAFSIDPSGEYGCFSHSKDRILSSRRDRAAIFNVETGQQLGLLSSHSQMQHPPETRLRLTKASWSPYDDVVLHNGSIWDSRRNRRIHCFESLGGIESSGTFHQNGLEVIINTEIWDLRTFRLLRTCPVLHGTEVQFNAVGDVILASPLFSSRSAAAYRKSGTFRDPLSDTCFRTVDARDYSEISTIDVEKPIMNLTQDGEDRFLAVTEKVDGVGGRESVVRIYEIGRKRRGLDAGDGDDDSDVSGEDRTTDEDLEMHDEGSQVMTDIGEDDDLIDEDEDPMDFEEEY